MKKYASMFGLDETSGIEIFESEPHISDMDPERSAIGQGTHAFANVQLARYVTALANRGHGIRFKPSFEGDGLQRKSGAGVCAEGT